MITRNNKYKKLIKHMIGYITDNDYDFVKCKTSEDFNNVAFSLTNKESKSLEILYKNNKGVQLNRKISPIKIFYGSTYNYHEEQWLLEAYDINKNDTRTFAMENILKIG